MLPPPDSNKHDSNKHAAKLKTFYRPKFESSIIPGIFLAPNMSTPTDNIAVNFPDVMTRPNLQMYELSSVIAHHVKARPSS